MRKFVALVLCAALGASPLPAQVGSVSGGVVAGQVALGVVAMPIGFVAGGLLTRSMARSLGASADKASNVAMVGAYAGAALATAIGPTLLASRGAASANYLESVGGAALGGLASAALIKLNKLGPEETRTCGVVCKVSAVAIVLLPSIGATVAANASRH